MRRACAAAAGQSVASNFTGGWFADHVWTMRPPRTAWGALERAHLTVYADLGAESVTIPGLPSNNTAARPDVALPGQALDRFAYGSEHCPLGYASGTNPATMWSCDRAQWVAWRVRVRHCERSVRAIFSQAFGERFACAPHHVRMRRGVRCYACTLLYKYSMCTFK